MAYRQAYRVTGTFRDNVGHRGSVNRRKGSNAKDDFAATNWLNFPNEGSTDCQQTNVPTTEIISDNLRIPQQHFLQLCSDCE